MPNIQEVKLAIGKHKQATLQTPMVAADMISLAQTNRDLPLPEMTTESNADDMGKGTPFATQIFKLAARSGGPIEARLSSVWAAMAGVFGIGLTSKSAAGAGFKYSCSVGTTFAALEADMPTTGIVATCRQGANDVFDYHLIGLACEEINLSLKTGIGRDTATIRTSWIGCGKFANPSTITMPAATTEHGLNIGGATALTLLGTNYVSNLRFLSCEFNWKNNIKVDQNYVPGGGTQDGYNIMGRMRRGTPAATFRATVEIVDGSTEWAAFLAGTTGTVVLTIVGDAIDGSNDHKLSLTLQQTQIKAHRWTESDGLIVADLEFDVQLHASNGVLLWDAWTDVDEIGTAAA